MKKRGFIPGVLFLALLYLTSLHLPGQQAGYKYFKNYSPKDYDHSAQNWSFIQAENGIIYVANQGGVLEFDGASWRPIGIPGYATVRSLAIDMTGTIYVGGIGEIGYLAPDKKGKLEYVSLLDYLGADQKKFSNVWSTFVIDKGVYFYSSEFLFRWNPGKKILIGLPNQYGALLTCGGNLYIRGEETGLVRMDRMDREGLNTVSIAGGQELKEKRIYMICRYNGNGSELLIGTYQNGLYIHDGETIKPFPTGVNDYLKKSKLSHGIRLSSGDFALATRLGGLVIIDPHGRLKHIFNKTSGLQDENVKAVFEDNQGNLWLALDHGISKIEYNSSFFLYDDRTELPGIVYAALRYYGDLYVGTSGGFYVLPSHAERFRNVLGIFDNCWDLLSIDDSILVATTGGVYHVKQDIKQKIIGNLSYVLCPSKHQPHRIWCGTNRGLVALIRKGDRWIEECRFEKIKQEIRSIVEDKYGRLWLGLGKEGVLKVDFPAGVNDPVIDQYSTLNKLSVDRVYVAMAAGHVMFATNKGILRYDEDKRVLIPDGTLGIEFDGSKPVFRIVEDNKRNIWIYSEGRNYRATPGPSGAFKIDFQLFRRIPTTAQANAIYPDPDGKTIWFATNEGLIRYDTTVEKNFQQDFQTLVRKIFVNENLIFDGYKTNGDKVIGEQLPVFEYKNRNFRFEFAAPFFEAETETRYQSFLEGYDENWSALNKDTKMNYTNLDAGQYTFRVRAKNVYGQFGDEDVFRFKVLPPWYKTWLAFLLYGIGSFLLIFFLIRWRSRRLEQEKEHLEQTVSERTKEIKEKNKQLETQTVKLKDQSEKLKEMDEVKSRFFANISHEFRTPLTLIMGPIEQMQSHIRDKEQKNTLDGVLQNSQRLLTLINQLLDLSRLDSGKMKLQAAHQNIVPFLKKLLGAFSTVALENKLNLKFQPEEEEISFNFDSQKMEEVMCNLLINAVKFTPPNGTITVSVSREGEASPGFVRISVKDTGVGISKEHFDHIFDRFFQAGNIKGKHHKGTGIGLALVKEIVTLHHGRIDVHSQEGKGTEFVIRLPLGNEHLEPGEISTAAGTAIPGDNKEKEIASLCRLPGVENGEVENGNGDQPIEPGASREDQTPGQENNVILVVEDNPDMRKYIRGPLEPHYTVVEAGDGKEGIKKAKEIIPDLIVSDIMMPEVDGYELCRTLKKDIETSHIPIVLLTAKASEESHIEGLETGADDYITKPFSVKILCARIKNLIDLRRQLQLKIQRQKMLLPSEISVSSMDDKFLKEFQGIIKKNIKDSDFSIDTLCEKLYMGRSTLFRKIHALTGETPNQFILSYRLERAAQLLKKKFGNVTEVAFEVGFTSSAYFSKCFKEKFHRSPSAFHASESRESTGDTP